MPITEGAAPHGDPRHMPGLHGTDRALEHRIAEMEKFFATLAGPLPPARPSAAQRAAERWQPQGVMTFTPDCVPCPCGDSNPRAAGTPPPTRSPSWALAARDREREAYQALYEALYGPPPGIRQEATA